MDLRVIEIKDLKKAGDELLALKVHKGGVEIMAPKAVMRVIKVSGVDSAALNILKQEMLSVGGDCAVSWDAFIRRRKNADGLIMGTVAQIDRLCEKLDKQPLGLSALAGMIRRLERDYEKNDFVLRAGKYRLNLRKRAHIMGILNVTPDSFSDGGVFFDKDSAIERALDMESQGADVIDIGGESTRPGAKTVSADEECERVIPVIRSVAKRVRIPISIDTSKSEVAKRALDCGAVMVNDITGLKGDPKVARVAQRHKAAVVVMHMKGTPRTMQKSPWYKDLVSEITVSLRQSIKAAKDSGISDDRIVVDPGIGFGKRLGDNLALLKRLGEFKSLGYPVMVGPSRKSFIGKISGAEVSKRIFGTAAAVALAIENGADIVRVHDVKEMRQVAQITEAISNA